MTEELGDLDLVRSPADPGSLAPRSWRFVGILAVVTLLVLGVGAGYWFLRRTRSQSAAPSQAQSADSLKIRRDPAELIPLPPLAETDPLVRQLVGALSSHPVVAAWLATDRLIDNFVVVTSRIADGQTPTAELKAIGPIAPFQTRASHGVVYIDPSSYHRYDRYAQAVAALDARGTARVYETLKPRVMEAERNFGGSESFDAQLERAIVELLEVPVVEGDVALKSRGGTGYSFADPRLEDLSAAQKQLLRMGPENVRAIQAKLREIAAQLQIPDSRLPPRLP
jgi:hypothetical protein